MITSFFSYITLDLSIQNGVGAKLPNIITLPQGHNFAQLFPKQKRQQNDKSRLRTFSNVIYKRKKQNQQPLALL